MKKLLTCVLALSILFVPFSPLCASAEKITTQPMYLSDTAISNLEDIRNNPELTDEGEIMAIVDLYLRVQNDQMINYAQSDFDYTPFYDTLSESYDTLVFSGNKSKLYKEMWKRNGVHYLAWDLSIEFNQLNMIADTASVDAYSALYSFSDKNDREPSVMGMQYDIDLIKHEDGWYLSKIMTNDHLDRTLDNDSLLATINEIIEGITYEYEKAFPYTGGVGSSGKRSGSNSICRRINRCKYQYFTIF